MAKGKRKPKRTLIVDRVIHTWTDPASDEIVRVVFDTDRGKVRLCMMAGCVREMNAAIARRSTGAKVRRVAG